MWLSKTVVFFVFETHEQNLVYTEELWSGLFKSLTLAYRLTFDIWGQE